MVERSDATGSKALTVPVLPGRGQSATAVTPAVVKSISYQRPGCFPRQKDFLSFTIRAPPVAWINCNTPTGLAAEWLSSRISPIAER